MTFDKFWNELNALKKIRGTVQMTPEQFKHMLNQAYLKGAEQANSHQGKESVTDILGMFK